ncbi:hypothetical protein [Alkalihalobacillus deserti]|uniref:hypothetical protein n=1 Tax=Alkalihalobacillus deserti TaxID=2879466 RepID=UPI001D152A2C|nr:hypothetical protein [Alkalihalobacillus deserti]
MDVFTGLFMLFSVLLSVAIASLVIIIIVTIVKTLKRQEILLETLNKKRMSWLM